MEECRKQEFSTDRRYSSPLHHYPPVGELPKFPESLPDPGQPPYILPVIRVE